MRKSAVCVATALLLASGVKAATAGSAVPTSCENNEMKAYAIANACPNVATGQKAATYQVRKDVDGVRGLEVTARPLADEASSPYLVQVFVNDTDKSTNEAVLLGTFSFYPVRVGQAQKFVLPKPFVSEGSTSKEFTLSVKLVPANATRTLKDAAVEIMNARLVN
jgi:hypothetical protein